MAFDPDKYLSEKTATVDSGGFDPDAYLKEKGAAPQPESAGLHLAKNLLHYVDLFNHLGQPDWAKHLVESVRGDQTRGDRTKGSLVEQYVTKPLSNDLKDVRNVAAGGLDMATSPTSYLLPFAGKVAESLKGVSPALEEGAASLASNSTKIPTKTLITASTPEGRAALNTVVESHPSKVNQLVSLANNPSKIAGVGSPIEAAVRAPEGAAAKIDINPTLKAFDDAKIKPTDFGGDAALALKVNAALDREKAAMMGELATPPKAGADKVSPLVDQYGGNIITPGKPAPPPPSPLVDPNKFRQIKTMIGKSVPWDSPEYKPFQSAMARVYSKMDQELTGAVSKSQGPDVAAQYQKDLADWSQKIGDFKELQTRLGKIPSNQINRANTLLTLKDASEGGNLDLLKRIDSHAGTDFGTHADLLDQAQDFKNQNNPIGTGNPSMYPKGGVWSASARIGIPAALGAKLGGPVGGAAGTGLGLALEGLNSPGIATKVAIPAARGVGKAIAAAPNAAAITSLVARLTDALKTTKSPSQKAAIERKLAELESQ